MKTWMVGVGPHIVEVDAEHIEIENNELTFYNGTGDLEKTVAWFRKYDFFVVGEKSLDTPENNEKSEIEDRLEFLTRVS